MLMLLGLTLDKYESDNFVLEDSKYRDQLSLKTFQYSQALTPETYEKRLISIFKSI